MRQGDLNVLTVTTVMTVAGLTLGTPYIWVALGTVAVVGMGYIQWRWRLASREAGDKVSRAASPAPHPEEDPLWADSESALRLLDRCPTDAATAQSLARLARAGRRAVERGRKAPADPASVQARHVLCMTAETLAAYAETSEAERQARAARVRTLVDQAADVLEQEMIAADEGAQLRLHLRVLEREIGTKQGKDEQ